MRNFAPEAIGLAAIFAVALTGSRELDTSYGGWAFPTTLAVFCVTALGAGRRNRWTESVSSGLAVGFAGPAMFYTGLALAYEWSGEFDHGVGPTLWLVTAYGVVYGVMFAAIGALLAALGHALFSHRWH